VSAVIDAQGRIVPGQSLSLGRTGVIDAPLPPPAQATLYSRWGEAPLAAMLLLSGLALISGRRRGASLGIT
jgi:apolipoprotein N-acyltransferase